MEVRPTEARTGVLDLLNQLRMALGQLRLYPASSPQAQKVVGAAHAALVAFPTADGRITIARTMRGLLINNKRLPAGDASALAEKSWLQLLQEAHVNSLVVLTAIRNPELSGFLDALARRFWELKDGKAINQRLRDAGVLQAWVEEVEFVAMAKGDLLIEGAAAKLAASGARVTEIVETLEQVIDSTSTEGLSEQVRLEIVRKLLDKDPLLIQKAQAMNYAAAEEAGGGGGGGSGNGSGGGPGGGTGPGAHDSRRTAFGTGRAPGWISFDQARKSLGEIARLLKQTQGAEREALRALGHLLVGGFRYDPLLLQLLKAFLTDEAIDLIPSWLLEEKQEPKEAAPQGPPPAEKRLAELLALPEDPRIEALRDHGPVLVKDLLAQKRGDRVGELVKCAVEHARHVSAPHRMKAVPLLQQLYPLVEAEETKESRAAIEARVVASLGLERDKAIYPGLVDLAAAIAETRILAGAPEAAVPVLEALHKQQQGEDKEHPERPEISRRGLEKVVAGKAFAALLEQVRAKNAQAVRAAEALGPVSATALVERMKASASMAERMALAQLILRAGPEAGQRLAEEMHRTLAPSEALKLLDLVRLAMPEAQSEAAIGTTLRHPALAVRRRAAAFLRGRPTARAGQYFLDALRQESDPSVRVLFVDALGDLKPDAAFPVLSQILEARSEPEAVRVAAAAALGSLGKPQAIPILVRVAAKGRGLTLVLNPAPTQVRAAAVRALGGFTRYPEARDALRRSMEDPDAAVQEAARESLAGPLIKAFGEAAREATVVSDADQAASYRCIAGLLADVPLDRVCQLIEEEGRTGLLLLNVGGVNAQVHINRGAVVAAEYNGARGQEAFNQFCRWEGAGFLFLP
ncbi:MAG TPA: HEAT repeat domain-containing protein, partial [Planctomycetota bacterium]|nr:HEAT repeat domain-containing protein [Planctomycetota bacterium]